MIKIVKEGRGRYKKYCINSQNIETNYPLLFSFLLCMQHKFTVSHVNWKDIKFVRFGNSHIALMAWKWQISLAFHSSSFTAFLKDNTPTSQHSHYRGVCVTHKLFLFFCIGSTLLDSHQTRCSFQSTCLNKWNFLTSYSSWHYHRHWGITVISENSLYFLKTPS